VVRAPRVDAGYLLIELLVALAVLAIPLAAMSRNLSQAIDTTVALRDRSMALWVAEDQLVQHHLRADWPEARTFTGTREMGGRTWRWQEVVSTTPVVQLRRIEIEVRGPDRADVLARLVTLLRDPRAR
jgi:general secretion pathway protein I